MLRINVFLSVGVMCAMGFVSTAGAAVIMDATTNNGSFDDPGSRGSWTDFLPVGWGGTPLNVNWGWTQNQTLMGWNGFTAFNNTGVAVTDNTVYTISGKVNVVAGGTVTLRIIATENSDGTGNAVELASVDFSDGDATGPSFTSVPTLFEVGPTASLATTTELVGAFVRVQVDANANGVSSVYYWVDDLVVTSAPVPEPGSIGLFLIGSALVFCRWRKAF